MSHRVLHHVAVRVQNLDRSKNFYEDLLGMDALERPDIGLAGEWYQAGGSELHLIGQDQAMKWDGIDPTGAHLALEIDDFEAVKKSLDEKGIEYLALGDGLLWVRDPDGNVVELREVGKNIFG